jgi:hypothetical protein
MSFTTTQFVLGYIAYYINPCFIALMFLKLLNIHFYTFQGDKETMSPVFRKLSPHIYTLSTKIMNGKKIQDGYFISKYAIGYINLNVEDILYIITLPKIYNMLTHDDTSEKPIQVIEKETTCNKIVVYTRKGAYKNFYYFRMTLDISHIQPIGQQQEIVSDVISIYNKLGRATIFIHGVSCAGKSTIGYLLAKQMEGIYCHTFNPGDPGDHLSSLITDINRDIEPLIIVIEEIDELIQKIHISTPDKNYTEIPILVHNKSTWSTFLDDMIFYKGVVLILTSNTPKQTIDDMDESYLRMGRIHKSYSMMNPLPLKMLETS